MPGKPRTPNSPSLISPPQLIISTAQHYVACAQVKVTGGGSANPATVSFPGAYGASDPGIAINVYYPVPTSYKMPGPAVFSG